VPACHVVERPDALLRGILRAREGLDSAPITLLGVRTNKIESDHSWIVSGRPIEAGIRSVAEFVFAPREHIAEQLLRKGALWDTLCCVADASTLWRVSARHLAAHSEAIRTGLSAGTFDALNRGYSAITPADFGRDVMARQLGIAVMDVTESGFREIATLEQVLEAFPGVLDRYQREASRADEPSLVTAASGAAA
jgi:mannose-1-phosphate guanylyltransferase